MHYSYLRHSIYMHIQYKLFNNYFFSVYINNCPPDFSINTLLNSGDGCLNKISFTPDDKLNILSSLDPNKAMGIDHISPKVLIDIALLLFFFQFIIFTVFYSKLSPL